MDNRDSTAVCSSLSFSRLRRLLSVRKVVLLRKYSSISDRGEGGNYGHILDDIIYEWSLIFEV